MIKENVPLSSMTTMGVGGRARRVVWADTLDELIEARSGSAALLGRGSNVIASDSGFDGTVLVPRLEELELTGDGVYAGAGVPLSKVALFCRRRGLTGMEWASGIPGSAGGAAVMNAGAFGSDLCASAVCVDVLEGGGVKRLSPKECGFGYRTSAIRGIVTGVCFHVRGGPVDGIDALMRKYAAMRRAAQPQGKSAGSVFKAADRPAAVYIDQAGLKGMRIGGAAVSRKHANFILNEGDATAADVRALIALIKETVEERFKVRLEEEVRYLGEF